MIFYNGFNLLLDVVIMMASFAVGFLAGWSAKQEQQCDYAPWHPDYECDGAYCSNCERD